MDRNKLIELLMHFFGFDGSDGTYWYCLTRVKEAFAVGTVTLDDFVEMENETLEELADEILKFNSVNSQTKHTIKKHMSSKYRVNFRCRKWISGEYCNEVWSEEEYNFYKDFNTELQALNFIEEDEYYYDENEDYYCICNKDNPTTIKM